ncbi:MAG TPA: hypothetical protein VGR62_06465 [Candidatus Binatia bacterium]|nr:hypothetical protein [Candidatus Binatia bacterium]
MSRTAHSWWLWGALLTVGVTYLARIDHVAGLYVDDAWYLVLAKAIASGEGFRLINAPAPGILPFYPPGLPALLSLVFVVAPEFPGNVWLLKAVSVVAMLGVTVLTVRWGERDRGLGREAAVALGLAVGLSPAFVFLAGATVMSEPVFTLLQLGSLVALERATAETHGDLTMRRVVIAALLGAAAALVRTMAVVVLVACLLHLLATRRWRAAAVYGAIVGAVVGGWTWWAAAHAPDAAAQASMNDAIVHGYADHFWMRVAGYAESGTVTAAELPARVLANLRMIALNDAGALSAYPWFRTIEPLDAVPGTTWTAALSVVLGVATLVGWAAALRERVRPAELAVAATVLTALVWPFPPFRFLLPLLPIVLLSAATGLGLVGRLVARRRIDVAVRFAVLAAVVVVNAWSNGQSIVALHRDDPPPAWSRAFDENVAMLAWARDHLEPDAILASHNPALVHLLTGRTTVGYWDARTNLQRWRAAGARYWVDCWLTAVKYPDPARSGLPLVHRQDGPLALRIVRLPQ